MQACLLTHKKRDFLRVKSHYPAQKNAPMIVVKEAIMGVFLFTSGKGVRTEDDSGN
jgi:hypothetical protein